MKYKQLLILVLLSLFFSTTLSACDIASSEDIEKVKEIGTTEMFANGFSESDGIVIDHLGNMFVGNRKNNTITKVDKEGNKEEFIKLPCAEVLCMTVDEDNYLYAAGKDKVFKINQKGDIIQSTDGFEGADDLRLDDKGNIFITDSFQNKVFKLTPDFKERSIFIDNDLYKPLNKNLWYITGITFDKDYKNLYLAELDRSQIVKFPILKDGSAGKPVVIAKNLPGPDHLEIDTEGNLYVTLFYNASLIKITPDGEQELIVKGGLISRPTGLAFGKEGFDQDSVYVADYRLNKIFKIYVGQKGI